jgi:hypothetical protein
MNLEALKWSDYGSSARNNVYARIKCKNGKWVEIERKRTGEYNDLFVSDYDDWSPNLRDGERSPITGRLTDYEPLAALCIIHDLIAEQGGPA